MSFQKFKSNSYCVGARHRSATKNIVGDITIIKKTGKQVKLPVGKCVICDGKKQNMFLITRFKLKVSVTFSET